MRRSQNTFLTIWKLLSFSLVQCVPYSLLQTAIDDKVNSSEMRLWSATTLDCIIVSYIISCRNKYNVITSNWNQYSKVDRMFSSHCLTSTATSCRIVTAVIQIANQLFKIYLLNWYFKHRPLAFTMRYNQYSGIEFKIWFLIRITKLLFYSCILNI